MVPLLSRSPFRSKGALMEPRLNVDPLLSTRLLFMVIGSSSVTSAPGVPLARDTGPSSSAPAEMIDEVPLKPSVLPFATKPDVAVF